MCRLLLLLPLLGVFACHRPALSSGGAPKPGTSIPSTACSGNAPVDPDIKGVPKVRASWFNVSPHERLYVLEAGPLLKDKPTLVLIHGVGDIGSGDFYPVLAELSRTRHVLAVDLPGFGRSNRKDDDFGPDRLASSVEQVVNACTSKRIDVLGHSSGGALALLFASKHPDLVRRLVLVDVAGILRPEVLLRGQLHQSLTDAREKAPVASKIAKGLGQIMIEAMQVLVPSPTALAETGLLGDSPPVLAATRLLDYNFGPAIARVRAETLLLWGKNDHVVPPRIAHLLDDRIARSELVFIEDAEHVPMKDQPAAFASMVAGYLNEGHALVPDSGPPGKREQDGKEQERAPKQSDADPEGPNVSTRIGRCDGQEDLILEGDYASIEVNKCKRVWLNRVRAQRILVKESEGRLDSAEVSDGVLIDDSEFSFTGGELRGPTALDVRESKLDIAGVKILGDERALRVDDKSELVFSVSFVESPKTTRVLHEVLARKEPYEM